MYQQLILTSLGMSFAQNNKIQYVISGVAGNAIVGSQFLPNINDQRRAYDFMNWKKKQ